MSAVKEKIAPFDEPQGKNQEEMTLDREALSRLSPTQRAYSLRRYELMAPSLIAAERLLSDGLITGEEFKAFINVLDVIMNRQQAEETKAAAESPLKTIRFAMQKIINTLPKSFFPPKPALQGKETYLKTSRGRLVLIVEDRFKNLSQRVSNATDSAHATAAGTARIKRIPVPTKEDISQQLANGEIAFPEQGGQFPVINLKFIVTEGGITPDGKDYASTIISRLLSGNAENDLMPVSVESLTAGLNDVLPFDLGKMVKDALYQGAMFGSMGTISAPTKTYDFSYRLYHGEAEHSESYPQLYLRENQGATVRIEDKEGWIKNDNTFVMTPLCPGAVILFHFHEPLIDISGVRKLVDAAIITSPQATMATCKEVLASG